MNIKITISTAIIIGGLIFCGSLLSNIILSSTVAKTALAQAEENHIRLDSYGKRLTVIETRIPDICTLLEEIKKDIREVKKEQLEFYKELRNGNITKKKGGQ